MSTTAIVLIAVSAMLACFVGLAVIAAAAWFVRKKLREAQHRQAVLTKSLEYIGDALEKLHPVVAAQAKLMEAASGGETELLKGLSKIGEAGVKSVMELRQTVEDFRKALFPNGPVPEREALQVDTEEERALTYRKMEIMAEGRPEQQAYEMAAEEQKKTEAAFTASIGG